MTRQPVTDDASENYGNADQHAGGPGRANICAEHEDQDGDYELSAGHAQQAGDRTHHMACVTGQRRPAWRGYVGGFFASGVGSRSSIWPVAISTMNRASWLASRGAFCVRSCRLDLASLEAQGTNLRRRQRSDGAHLHSPGIWPWPNALWPPLRPCRSQLRGELGSHRCARVIAGSQSSLNAFEFQPVGRPTPRPRSEVATRFGSTAAVAPIP